MSVRAMIVDDEPLAVEGLRRFCEQSGLVDVVGDACDGQSALELASRLRPDAVFLDIGMPGLSGIDVAGRLRSLERRPQVVFVTAYDDFATEAFDLSVVDYVLKPLDPARLTRAFARLAAHCSGVAAQAVRDQELWVPSRGGVTRIGVDSIDRVEAERDYVRLFTEQASYLLRVPISAIEARLGFDSFVRVHRSIMVRLDRLVALRHVGGGTWIAVDASGVATRIGRSYLASVRARLGVSRQATRQPPGGADGELTAARR